VEEADLNTPRCDLPQSIDQKLINGKVQVLVI